MKLIVFTLCIFCSLEAISQSPQLNFEKYRTRILNDSSLNLVRESANSEELLRYHDSENITTEITELISNWNSEEFILANPNEPYNATDLVDPDLPTRRLISIYKNSTYTFLLYEHGGLGHHYHLAWFKITNNKITDVWSSTSFTKIESDIDLINFVNSYERAIKLKNGRKVYAKIHF